MHRFGNFLLIEKQIFKIHEYICIWDEGRRLCFEVWKGQRGIVNVFDKKASAWFALRVGRRCVCCCGFSAIFLANRKAYGRVVKWSLNSAGTIAIDIEGASIRTWHLNQTRKSHKYFRHKMLSLLQHTQIKTKRNTLTSPTYPIEIHRCTVSTPFRNGLQLKRFICCAISPVIASHPERIILRA